MKTGQLRPRKYDEAPSIIPISTLGNPRWEEDDLGYCRETSEQPGDEENKRQLRSIEKLDC